MADRRPASIGILETGKPPAALAHFGSYPAMVAALLGESYDYKTFDVTRSDYPESPTDHAAYVITGSSAGVYDALPWIEPLKTFLRAARGHAKLVGICFGHQIMADAFGGRVEKSEKGWGLGLHNYAISDPAAWMDGPPAIAIAVSHQDQVVETPPDARAIGGSAFTPNGILAYDDGGSISFQCHPEFESSFVAALIEARRPFLPGGAAEAMLSSLAGTSDRMRVGTWIRRFLDRS